MRRWTLTIALAAVPSLLAGCVEHDETIRVEANGRVHLAVAMTADAEEELRVDRVPSGDDGWRVTRGERDEKFTLTATLTLAPDEPFPSSFADPGADTAGTELEFPTEVVVERRGGVTYYHFRREYGARTWANVAAVEARVRQQFDLPAGEHVDFDELTTTERARLIQALATLEVNKALVLARAAFLDVAPDAPQDTWLAARAAALARLGAVDAAYLASLVAAGADPLAQLQLQKEGERYERDIRDAMLRALADADLEPGVVNAFAVRLEWYGHQRKATEELAMQKFKVAVTMPGTIVASNADISDGATARWSFDGAALQDRRVELMVTSRVP